MSKNYKLNNKNEAKQKESKNYKSEKKNKLKRSENKKYKLNNKNITKDKERKSNIYFTKENINSHLISYTEDSQGYNIYRILIYLFKEFSENDGELLAKMKVLSKMEDSSDSFLPRQVLQHVFKILNMKGSFNENILKLIRLDNKMGIIVGKYYFGSEMNKENFESSFELFLEEINKIWNYSDNKEKNGDISKKLEQNEKMVKNSEEVKGVDKKEIIKEFLPGYDSDCSLISLNDENKIAELDEKFGMFFRKSGVSDENIKYSVNLLKCLEELVKNNEIDEIYKLERLLYLYEHENLKKGLKYLIKEFIQKVGDSKKIYQIYNKTVVENPETYSLYSTFLKRCGDEFKTEEFIKTAIEKDYGEMLLNRIDSKIFYKLYNDNLRKIFYIELINIEQDIEVLKSELLKENREDIINLINTRISKIESKQNVNINKNKKRKLNNQDRKEYKSNDNKSNDNKSNDNKSNDHKNNKEIVINDKKVNNFSKEDPIETKDKNLNDVDTNLFKSKRTFRDKIGHKIYDERMDKKKKFRIENYKAKMKLKKEKRKKEKSRIKFTKKMLRDGFNIDR